MGPSQQENTIHKDVLDGLITATQKYEERKDENGKVFMELVQDHKSLKYKLQNVPSPYYGRYVRILERLFGKSIQAQQHTNPERAIAAARQIMDDYNSHQYSTDGISAQSRLNKLNRTPNIVGILASQKTEKTISFKEDAKRTFLESITGKQKQQALDD